MNKIVFILLSMPKTIVFNLKAFKLKDALKVPIIISYKTKLRKNL